MAVLFPGVHYFGKELVLEENPYQYCSTGRENGLVNLKMSWVSFVSFYANMYFEKPDRKTRC